MSSDCQDQAILFENLQFPLDFGEFNYSQLVKFVSSHSGFRMRDHSFTWLSRDKFRRWEVDQPNRLFSPPLFLLLPLPEIVNGGKGFKELKSLCF
jgi:hypothetical protein